MAEFCKQCADEYGWVNTLAGLCTPEDNADDRYLVDLCEGCGPTYVDADGNCMGGCAKQHPDRLQHLQLEGANTK